jgi:hypothetical protein
VDDAQLFTTGPIRCLLIYYGCDMVPMSAFRNMGTS